MITVLNLSCYCFVVS